MYLDQREYASNVYMNGDIYSVLYSNQLILYFINSNQEIQVTLPTNIEIQSAKNVFVFQADPRILGISGYLILAFGLTNFALIIVSPETLQQGQNHYHIQWVKDYQQIQATGAAGREYLSCASLSENQIKVQRTGFPIQELTFLLGAGQSQKLVQLKVSLRNDQCGPLSQVETSNEEILIYQEPKSFGSRISSFLTSKLGYRGQEEETNQAVKFIHIVAGFIIMITSKDLLIIRRSDNLKIYESDYLETLKQQSQRSDSYENSLLMRQLLNFSLLTSSAVQILANNQICINLFILKQQLVQNPQSYTSIKQTQIVHQPRIFALNGDELFEKEDNLINVSDIDKYSENDPVKAFAFNFEFYTEQAGDDVTTLLILEFVGGKTIAIEHSLASRLQNIQTLRSFSLLGYHATTYIEDASNDRIVSITLLTKKDIEQYIFFPSQTQFSMVIPEGIISNIGISAEQVPQLLSQSITRQPQLNENVIFNRESLRPFIIRMLDLVAQYKYAQTPKQSQSLQQETIKQQALNAVKAEVKKTMVPKTTFLEEIRAIIKESMDLSINDNHFGNMRGDELFLAFSDDGLVQNSLDNKNKKLDVIMEFLYLNDFYTEEDVETKELINQVSFNLFTARLLRDIQEDIKERLGKQSSGYRSKTDYPLEMRVICKVIQQAAEKLKYSQEQLNSLGVTSANVVYANITQIDIMLLTLIDLSLDHNIQTRIELGNKEDNYSVVQVAAQLLIQIFEQYLTNSDRFNLEESFISDVNFLEGVYSLCEKLCQGVNDQRPALRNILATLTEQFMQLTIKCGKSASEEFDTWKNNLVIILESGISQQAALEFAEKYQSKDLLCRLVFDLGKSSYNVIHRCVDNWGQEFLAQSMERIYELEKCVVKERNPEYKGFQMFAIFEQRYLNELTEFLAPRNKKLLCLLQLRQQEAQFANELMKNEVLPYLQGVQTVKVFSSLAVANIENCIPSEQRFEQVETETYYNAKLNLANVQSQVLPLVNNIVQIDRNFVDKTFAKISQESPDTNESNLRQILDIVDHALITGQILPENVSDIKTYAWRLVMRVDQENVKKLNQCLPKQGDQMNLYTERQIVQEIERSHLYILANEKRNESVNLEEHIQKVLLNEFIEFQRGLMAIFKQLRVNDTANMFSQRQSLAPQSTIFKM